MKITFLPIPRKITEQPGKFHLKPGQFIQLHHAQPQRIMLSAQHIKAAFDAYQKICLQLTASQTLSAKTIGIKLTVNPDFAIPPQGYQLSITPDQIRITGADDAGVFYGVQTLKQIITQSRDGPLPCMDIEDWPDFQVRGVMLDISRDKVYRMETLLMLVDEMASWKINQLQLYMEHTFAYQGHELVWQNASPMTAEEVLALDRYCQERFIELVPNQNSFGHMSRWLVHPPYSHLAETTEPVPTPWGGLQIEPFSLAPVLPESLAFVTGLYDQLLPNFSSKMVNVGCDETFDIGMGRSKQAVDEKGKGQVYLDYLLSLYDDLKNRGYTMQYWGDIILEHPELIQRLPKDAIALNWGYEAAHPFDVETRAFQEAGLPFYVCPGTSAWNSLAGRTENMLENIRNAAVYGLKNGAIGLLNTDWGDNGHWQQLPISYPGLAAGAAQAWSVSGSLNLNLAEILNQVIFFDEANKIGNSLVEMGNLHKAWGLLLPNSSPLFWLLQETQQQIRQYPIDTTKPIHASLADLAEMSTSLQSVTLNRPDGQLMMREIALTIQMLQLACQRALYLFDADYGIDNQIILREIDDIKANFSACWLTRNRPGGLSDSLNRFSTIIDEFSAHA
jgi:hexosaminidase